MRRALAFVPLCFSIAAACSSFDSDDPAPVTDAGPDAPVIQEEAGPLPDADADADAAQPRACDLDKPFDAPAALNEINSSAHDQTPRLTADELTIVFESTRGDAGTGYNLFTATRASRKDPFGTAAPIVELNTTNNDAHAWISPNGTTLLFARAPLGNTDWEIFKSTRSDAQSLFANVTKLDANINFPNVVDHGPFFSNGVLFFATNRTGTGGVLLDTHIWQATGSPEVSFAAATKVELGAPDTDGEDAPVVSADGLTLYTSRIRKSAARTDYDVMVSTRASLTAPFAASVPVPELASPTDHELPAWLSPDRCRLYLTKGPVGGQLHLYVAKRPL